MSITAICWHNLQRASLNYIYLKIIIKLARIIGTLIIIEHNYAQYFSKLLFETIYEITLGNLATLIANMSCNKFALIIRNRQIFMRVCIILCCITL